MIQEIIKLRELTEKLSSGEEKLAKAVKEMQLAFDSLMDLVIIVDVDHNVKYANKAALNTLNMTEEELFSDKYKICRDLLCDKDDEECLKDMCKIGDKDKKVIRTERYYEGGRLNGWYRRTRTLIINGNDTIIGALCMFRDISKRKKIEHKLRKSQERFHLFMDHVPLGVFIKDSDLKTVYVNKYMLDTFKLVEDDYMGKTPMDLFPKEAAEKMVEADKAALEKGQHESIDIVPHKDGKEHVYKTCKFVIDRNGEPTLLGGVTIDVTDNMQISSSNKK